MISDRIKAHRSAPDVYEPPTFDQMANRIEELQAQNKRLETEAQLQAEEIDKTRRRADKWQSTVLDCDEYLKPGETPAERIQREINDCLALMKLLEKKQKRIEELEAKLEKAVEALGDLADCVDDGCFCSEMRLATTMDQARTTLAELKGETE